MEGFTDKRLRERYVEVLDPSLKPTTEPWTEDENALLYHGYQAWGPAWAQIAWLIPGRSANRVKNRWNIKSRPFSKEAGKRAAAVVARADLSGNANRNEGAYQKKSGEWISRYFPGREFDDLDELRAAKKQRK